jgi:hypothetical protein
MLSVNELLVELDEAKITLTYKQLEGKLNAKPSAALTPELIKGIKEHKTSLIKTLCEHPVETVDSTEPEGRMDRVPLAFDARPGEVISLTELKERRARESSPNPLDRVDTVDSEDAMDTRARRNLARASRLGLIAMWSREFGYISIHDPTTGEWHDLSTKEAPDWARREAFRRKELRKCEGITRTLTASEMQEIWSEEQAKMWEHPAVTDKGIVYEDYIDEE